MSNETQPDGQGAPLIQTRVSSYNSLRQNRRRLATLCGLGHWYFEREWVGPHARHRRDLSRNREIGVVYVHVPKCGGISVQETLGIRHPGHAPAIYYHAELPEVMAQGYSFGFCRNPYDRLVSAFHFLKHSPRTTNDVDWADANLHDLDDFAAFMRALANPWRRSRILTRLHFFPQHWFLCDRAGRPLVKRVGRFENFAEELKVISDEIGIDVTQSRKVNTSKRDAWMKYFGPREARTAHAIYRRDFEIFGYPRLAF